MDEEATWTVERTAQAERLCIGGHSAAEIAAKLGGITRNAVQGKLLRLGLRLRGGAGTKGRPKTRTFINAVAVAHSKEARKLDRPVVEKPRADAPTPLLIPLIELRPRHCRWPIGDPGTEGFGFCGHAKAGEGPYCPHHTAIAYVPVDPRRRRIREPA